MLLALLLAMGLQVPFAFAQTSETSQTDTQAAGSETANPDAAAQSVSEDELKAQRALQARLKARAEQEKSLSDLQDNISLSQSRQEELEREIAQLKSDRQTIQSDLIATANRIKSLEQNLSSQETRLKTLFEDQTTLRVSLAEQRDSLSEILAALQRIGRNPPPALVIHPNEALKSVRSAILLSTLVPEIRIEARALATQLEQLIIVQTQIEEEKGALQTSLIRLGEERKRLDLLQSRKKTKQDSIQQAANNEAEKTQKLALEARNLQELIDGMEREIEAAKLAVQEAKDAERTALEQKLETKKQKIAALKDAARLSPAIPFSKMRGLLRLPAQGSVLKTFGSGDGFGGKAKGLSLATRTGAQVTSPADGWIVYSGPFRSFGKLLIINAGDGYHIVLSGLDILSAQVGDFVLANEPIGRMQETQLATADLLDASASRPVLYMELRKNGEAINPAPWWILELKEKADG